MQDDIKAIIREHIMGQAKLEKLEDHEKIIEANFLDSMGLVEFASWLENRFAIRITDEDFSEENFVDLISLTGFVEKKQRFKGI
jgi:acyl carrier protein